MSSSPGEKRPPSSSLESADAKRKMESGSNDGEQGSGGATNVDISVIMADIRSSLPTLMNKILDSNMAAMEDRLKNLIAEMTKRLEKKIDSSNVSTNDRLENIETVQEGFSGRLNDFEDRMGNMETLSDKIESAIENNAGLHDMIIALAKRVVSLENYQAKEEENQYLKTRVE